MEFSSGLPKTNPASGREENLNPGPPDYKSSALTTRPRCLPVKGITSNLLKSSDLPHLVVRLKIRNSATIRNRNRMVSPTARGIIKLLLCLPVWTQGKQTFECQGWVIHVRAIGSSSTNNSGENENVVKQNKTIALHVHLHFGAFLCHSLHNNKK